MHLLLRRFPPFLGALAALLCAATSRAADTIPAAPASHVLDQAHVLLPEAVDSVSAVLLRGASSHGVAVYVATVPSLGVPPSKAKERLEDLANQYAVAWTRDVPGAVILFDDESGLMSLALSQEADRKFSTLELNLALEQPLRDAQRQGISRDKLQRIAEITVQILGDFQDKAAAAERHSRIANTVMAAIAFIGISLAIWSAVSGKKSDEPLAGTDAGSEKAQPGGNAGENGPKGG